MKRLYCLLPLLFLASCATSALAPVEKPINTAEKSNKPVSPTTAVAATEALGKMHVVQQKETIYSIAAKYDISYLDLMRWNGISNPSQLHAGSTLRLTAPANTIDELTPIVPAIPQAIVSSGEVSQTQVTDLSAPLGVVDEPKGGKLPYSPQALAKAGVDVNVPAPTPPTPASPPSTLATKSKWIWPVPGAILAKFDQPQSTSTRGLDLAGNPGDLVRAAATGRVVYAGNSLKGFGKMVILRHEDDFISVYAHNRRLLVKEKQEVKQGDSIAELGDSEASRPMLHFEIRRRGITEDPLNYLPPR